MGVIDKRPASSLDDVQHCHVGYGHKKTASLECGAGGDANAYEGPSLPGHGTSLHTESVPGASETLVGDVEIESDGSSTGPAALLTG